MYVHGDNLSSVEQQEQFLRSYLRQHHPDWPLVAIYQDTAPPRSKPPLRRPGMRGALQAASSGAFDVLLTERLTRIGRHIEHVTDVAERLHAASVVMLTADGTLSTADPLGKLIMGIHLAVVSYEREQQEVEQTANRNHLAAEATVPPSRLVRRATRRAHGRSTGTDKPAETRRPAKHGDSPLDPPYPKQVTRQDKRNMP